MKKILVLLFLLIFFRNNIITAQKNTDIKELRYSYTTVKPKGDLPNDLSLQFSEAYKREKEALEKNNSAQHNSIKKTKDKFLQESNYFINQILLSGKLLYNTDFNDYIDKILDKILINNADLRKQIRVYVLKSPTVNAFATDKGILFVNLGLLAQMGSESQLAFILSHELIHYVKKHNMDLYLEKDKISRENKGFRSATLSQILYKTHFRSHEMENEADDKGFTDYFSKTNYDINQAMEVYDVLQYAYLPFDEVAFNPAFLSDSLFKFPEKYLPESINTIKARDDYNDETSTHPNIKKRRESMQNKLNGFENKGRKINPSGEEIFKSIRDMSRFECLKQYIIDQNFIMAFYNAWLMKKDYPENSFLDKILAASLYGITKYKNRDLAGNVIPGEKKTEGEIHAVVSLFRNMKKSEFNAIALRYVYKACLKYPNDQYLQRIKKDLFTELIWGNKAKSAMFVNTPQFYKPIDTLINENIRTDSIQKQSSKVRNIEKKKKIKTDEGFYTYIFAGLLNDKDFSNDFKSRTEEYEKEKEEIIAKNKKDNPNYEFDEAEYDYYKEDDKGISNHERNFGCKLGIDSILLYNPFYLKIDYNKSEKIKFFDTESSQLNFIDLLKKNARKVGLSMDVAVPSALSEKGTVLYNDLLILNEWTDEFSNWDVKGNKILFLSDDIKSIIQKYNTKYLNLAGIISSKSTSVNSDLFYMVIYSVISPVIWPITIQYIASQTFNSMFYNLLLDMDSGEVVFLNTSKIEMRDNKALLNSKIYDNFNQIKTK